MEEIRCLLWLVMIFGAGNPRIWKALHRYHSPQKAVEILRKPETDANLHLPEHTLRRIRQTGEPRRPAGVGASQVERQNRNVVCRGRRQGRTAPVGIRQAGDARPVRSQRRGQHHHRHPRRVRDTSGRPLLPAGRPRPQYRRGRVHRRDSADFGHHLPYLRLQPQGRRRQYPRTAHRAGEGSHRLHRAARLPHQVRAGAGPRNGTGVVSLLHHVALRPDRSADARLRGARLVRRCDLSSLSPRDMR